MKIISLNMAGRSNFGQDFDVRMRDIAKFLDNEQADVVCLQEVTFYEGKSIVEKCNDQMTNPYPFTVAQMSENYTFDKFSERFRRKWDAGLIEHDGDFVTDGMAILSKVPIKRSLSIILKPAPENEDDGRPDYRVRLVQIATLESGVTIANVHFASNGNAYLQLRELLSYYTPDVVVGDFNIHTWDLQKYKEIWDSNYRESTDFKDYISFPKENATFDHMLLRFGYEFKAIEKFDGISDHSAMIFTIERTGGGDI